MNQGYLMVLFLLVIGLIPAAVWLAVNREGIGQGHALIHYIKTAVFFFLCNYFFSSAVKWYLGNPGTTLPESFWSTELRTYMHYGVALMLIDIVTAAGACTLLRRWSNKLIGIFNAGMLFLIVLAVLLGGVSNALYCIIFIICGGFSIVSVLVRKTEFVYFAPKEYKTAFREAVPVIGSWLVTIGIYLPSELYINNSNEFMIGYGVYLTALLTGSVILAALLMVGAAVLLPQKLHKLFLLFMSGISIMSYVQGMFLNGKLQSLTGEEQTWTMGTQAANLLLWIIMIGIIMIGGYYKVGIGKGCKAACVYIMLIQMISLGWLLITEDIGDTAKRPVLTTEGSLTLAKEDNILVFVLDRFDSSDFDNIVKDTEFVQPLSDFTYYRNATSQYAYTQEAIPYILERTEYRHDAASNDMTPYKDMKGDALIRMHQQGYNIGIYTLADYAWNLRDIVVNYKEDAAYKCDYVNTIKTMFTSSMYRTVPFAVKAQYRYTSTDIYEIAGIDGVWNYLNDLPFYQSLLKDGLHVNEECKSAFRFYHMDGVHPPYYLSEDLHYDRTGEFVNYTSQAKGCLKIVYEYLAQLKALGKYEDATIIITADHGIQAKYDEQTNQVTRGSSPIILVKEAQERHEEIAVSDAPVTQTELMPTILKAAGMDWTEYGRTFCEVDEEENRERKYKYYYYGQAVIYSINGYVKDISNWNVENIFTY